MPKLILGWFTFTCSEDSTILMTEILNTKWPEWRNYLDFKYAKSLRKAVPLGPMDVAFVEGAISADSQVAKLKTIRSLAKILVAVGSCACTGQPSAQRNDFDSKRLEEIKLVMIRFNYADKIQKLSDIVTVDHQLPGCPMDETKFVELINMLITNFQKTQNDSDKSEFLNV